MTYENWSVVKKWRMRGKRNTHLCIICEYKTIRTRWLTAYVSIPRTHKWYRKDEEKLDVNVRGGLTFSGTMLTWFGSRWFIGWDYAHICDCIDIDRADCEEHQLYWTVEEVEAEVREFVEKYL